MYTQTLPFVPPKMTHFYIAIHTCAIFYVIIVCSCLCLCALLCSYIPLYHIIIITCHVLYIPFAAIVINSISITIIRVIIVREALLNCVCDVLFSLCVCVPLREPILRLSEWFFARLFWANIYKWKRIQIQVWSTKQWMARPLFFYNFIL